MNEFATKSILVFTDQYTLTHYKKEQNNSIIQYITFILMLNRSK